MPKKTSKDSKHKKPTSPPSGGKVQNTEAVRFGPTNPRQGRAPADAFEPGIVEIEFRDRVQPRMARRSSKAPSGIASAEGANLSGLNDLLERHKLQKAEPSFQKPTQPAGIAQSRRRERGVDVPNLENFVTLHFPPEADTQQIADELRKLDEVERAVAVPKIIPALSPLNEPLLGTNDQLVSNPTGLEKQWYIFRCRTDRAWAMATGEGVVVADIDFGFLLTHQDIASRVDLSRTYNSFDGGTNVSTGNSIWHGTAVLGLAGGGDNDLGITGFAPRASLWAVQADTGPGPRLPSYSWAHAIDWVRTADSGGRRKVIILEGQTGAFGNIEMIPSVNAAIRTAIAEGIVVCVAAGNGNRDAGIGDSGIPIQETGSILVGATRYHSTDNSRLGRSNWGPRIVVSAPGDESHDVTCNSVSNTAYRNPFGGTSGASPKVAGTVALMLEVNPELTHQQIRTILNTTGSPIVTDQAKPVGTFLNAEAAVSQAALRRVSSAAVSSGPSRLHAFATGTNSRLFHKQWDGSAWAGYEDLGGSFRSSAEALFPSLNRLDVFAVGIDSHLYHKWWDGAAWLPSLTSYEDLGGTILGSPKVACAGPNRLDVFVVGANSRLLHKWWDGSAWVPSVTGYEDLGGTIFGSPEVVARGSRLDVFVVSTDSRLLHKWWDGSSWGPSVNGYEDMGGTVIGSPAAVSLGPNRLDIFVVGANSRLLHKWWNGAAWNPSLTSYEDMGGVILSSPAAVSLGPNRLDVFAVGADSRLLHKWWNGSVWSPSLSGYEDMGGPVIGQPRVSALGSNRLDVFAVNLSSSLVHKWWDGSAWRPSLTGFEDMSGPIIRF